MDESSSAVSPNNADADTQGDILMADHTDTQGDVPMADHTDTQASSSNLRSGTHDQAMHVDNSAAETRAQHATADEGGEQI